VIDRSGRVEFAERSAQPDARDYVERCEVCRREPTQYRVRVSVRSTAARVDDRVAHYFCAEHRDEAERLYHEMGGRPLTEL
jgi:hypothetical protein